MTEIQIWVNDFGEWEVPTALMARFKTATRKDGLFDRRKTAGKEATEYFRLFDEACLARELKKMKRRNPFKSLKK